MIIISIYNNVNVIIERNRFKKIFIKIVNYFFFICIKVIENWNYLIRKINDKTLRYKYI